MSKFTAASMAANVSCSAPADTASRHRYHRAHRGNAIAFVVDDSPATMVAPCAAIQYRRRDALIANATRRTSAS